MVNSSLQKRNDYNLNTVLKYFNQMYGIIVCLVINEFPLTFSMFLRLLRLMSILFTILYP